MKINIIAIAFLLAVMVGSCGMGVDHGTTVDTVVAKREYAPASVKRLDMLVYDYSQLPVAERDSLAESMSGGVSLYLQLLGQLVADNEPTQGLEAVSETAAVRIFGRDVKQRMADMSAVEQDLGRVSERVGELYPKAHIGDIYAVISPYRQGVVISDSTVLIVSNLYLGSDYAGYQGFDNYFRSTREPARIAYDVAEGVLASAYPYTEGESASALSKMLYNGALVYGVIRALDNGDPARAIGVTNEQLQWLEANRKEIWKALIDKNMLYSTSELDADKLIAPAGTSVWLHPEAPGRVGRFVGLDIVRSYMAKHPDIDPAWLLTADFYNSQRALVDAGYAP